MISKILVSARPLVLFILVILAVAGGYAGSAILTYAQQGPQLPGETAHECVARNLSAYMNTVVAADNWNNINLLSPAFNLTNPNEATIFNMMRTPPNGNFIAANFGGLWGYAGNTYWVDGQPGMYYYRGNGWDLAFAGKPVVFTEFGYFFKPGDPPRDVVMPQLIQDFNDARGYAGAGSMNYFSAIRQDNLFNPQFIDRHELSAYELLSIIGSSPGSSGLNPGLGFNPASFNAISGLGLGQGWGVGIIYDPGYIDTVAETVNNSSLNIIVRLCDNSNCGFSDPNELVSFLNDLNSQIGRPVWVIAGPNEPATEYWAAPGCARISGEGNPTQTDLPVPPSGPAPVAQHYDYTPCNEVANPEEFHSLRPYPTSPCDTTLPTEVLMCGEDLTVREGLRFSPRDPATNGECSYIGMGAARSISCNYTVTSTSEVALNFGRSYFPIMGNTEIVSNRDQEVNPANTTRHYANLMNEYVSWYLNGTTGRAEEEDEFGDRPELDLPDLEVAERVSELINFSGPIKKLLPWQVQNFFAETGLFNRPYQDPSEGPIGIRQNERNRTPQRPPDPPEDRHNQIVVCTAGTSFFPVPCYHTSGALPRRLNDIVPQAPPSGNNLFDFIPFSSTEDLYGDATLTLGGGQVAQATFSISSPNTTKKLYFAHIQESIELGEILKGTFKPTGVASTPPLPSELPNSLSEQLSTSYCEQVGARTNPGDKLYGNLERGTGIYTNGEFDARDPNPEEILRGDLSYTLQTSCAFPIDTTCYETCIVDAGYDSTGATADFPPLNVVDSCSSYGACYTASCGVSVDIPFDIDTYTPKANDIWDTFVAGRQSIVRRIFPRIEEGAPIEELEDILAYSPVDYYSANTSIDGADALSHGNLSGDPANLDGGAQGRLYFPHIGSVQEYFLTGIQEALRPFGYQSLPTDSGGPGTDPGTPPTGQISCPYTPTEVASAMAAAAAKYGVPIEMLEAIYQTEGAVYRTNNICEANSAGAVGMMQIRPATYNIVTCEAERTPDEFASCTAPTGTLSRCDVNGAFEIAARVLLWDAGQWGYGPGICNDLGNISNASGSEARRIGCAYYGYNTNNQVCPADPLVANYANGALQRGEILACRAGGTAANPCANMDYGDWVCAWMASRNGLNYCNTPDNFPPRESF